ncbi:hypothetical protein GGQ80_001612 [Sphingomonas jinjuensis]|uniref:Uncharacterized protein n=1 Tax=Sphingomonas jinjuensis TaxID=535907 RepID=A0A840FBU4_9SPHN|nr:hypothetical protein [Sphingomonas jinjuensis]MBB4153706.1 hypothetical protein [Sphingomonas jinjuensis]
MIHPAIPVTLLALLAPTAAGRGDSSLDGVSFAQLTIRQRIIVRVPVSRAPPPKPIRWKEKKGPKCVAIGSMAGALVSEKSAVDLVMTGGKRIRAKLDDDCRPLDFYSGFYLKPSADGMACAGRDSIRVRSGASCGIDGFKNLVARD